MFVEERSAGSFIMCAAHKKFESLQHRVCDVVTVSMRSSLGGLAVRMFCVLVPGRYAL